MDGTTANSMGIVPPTPQPNPQPQVSLPQTNSVGVPSAAGIPPQPQPATPTIQPPTQPQFSQVTPVYAPSPTNSIVDIPQPTVKGIEFVQTPTVLSPPIEQPASLTAPANPPTIPQPAVVSPPPEQLMQPVLPTTAQPVESPGVAKPLSNVIIPSLTTADISGPANYARIENQINNVDINQMAGAVPASVSQVQPTTPPMPPVTAPTEPASILTPTKPTNSYFQSGGSIVSDVPITESKPPLGGMDPRLIRRILIIIGIVIVVGIGGFFIANAIIGSQPQTTPITESETPQTPVEPEPTPTPEEPAPETPTTEEPAPTPAPTPPPVETPAPTPAPPASTPPSETIPTVANSGIQ